MGKEKPKKERKKTIEEINAINRFYTYINKYSAKFNFVKSVDSEEQADKDSFRVIAVIDCGAFKQRIIYYPEMLFESHFIDTDFQFENSEYHFSFYDIFNLFDIDDFNLYYYGDNSTAEDVEHAIRSIFEATEKYLYDLKKAGTADNLPQLIKNYETDMENAYGSDDWKEDAKDDICLFLVPANHPLISFADGQMNEKAIKKLKKKSEKGKLDTIYEKRLLKYVEQGRQIERSSISTKKKYEKTYTKKHILMNAGVFICSFAVILALSFTVHAFIFKGAELFSGTHSIFGIETTLPVGRIVLSLITAFVVTAEIIILFGKKLLVKAVPEEMKNYAESKYSAEAKKDFGKLTNPIKILAAVILIIVALFSFSLSVEDIGFYDDCVKYSDGLFFGTSEVRYKDMDIYKLKGYYDDDDNFVEYENAYLISDPDGSYYDWGELQKGGTAEEKLLSIVKEYNKPIAEITSVEEIVNVERE